MRTRSPLVLDVHELLESPRSRRPVSFVAPVGSLEAGLVRVPGEVSFDLVVEAIDGGIVVQGSMAGVAEGACRRCLKPVTQSFRFDATEVYRPPGEVWEEGYVIAEDHVDLEPMVRDTVALNLPASPLCRDDCAGLCSHCGADLNDGPCGCVVEEVDPRWSALKELGLQLEERTDT